MRQTISRHASASLSCEPDVPSHDDSLEFLLRELQHRMRNLLSIVQCFVANTEANTAEDFRAALASRIATLSDAYTMIEHTREHRISLVSLLQRTLEPHGRLPSNRISLVGPDITLDPHIALPLHLVFHELATNACKHGALTSATGIIEVLWEFPNKLARQTLAVQWRELGGPKVEKPKHRGFGMHMIAKALSGAQVELDFAPEGLVYRLLLELAQSPQAHSIV